jgi:hypothetical protein
VNDRNVIHRTGSSVKFQIGLAFDGRRVPIGMSRLGWGTVTTPGFSACLK